ncbi:hypothetical protein PUW24_06080 [Paenibacillus urinalis]|uniref:Uncharacterized protein n=1 Tax=Paenibacillus urinalis TaxID=521520 RepID=A0AAX3MZW4_9BACL|nr:hypothetical protein [Paenibacillus urinalis]WDH82434.1 hypothetical protein PUW23_23810 [Paenibacillus urinalis]WDH98491.1 hypothetical protein PUW24_06080 [Paenibacillus urinalis]WDI02182.1 hypothetical protein PUW25_23805 [Paenibacillus urinalis]
MMTATVTKIEVCDFCGEESPMGCTGIGPKTEVGVIEVMSICPRCRLTSLHSSIESTKKKIEEYQKRDMLLEDYEWENYFLTEDSLEDYILDLRYLVNKTIEHYTALYPLLIQPLNASISGATRSGIYAHLDQGDRVKVRLVEIEGPSMHLYTISAAFSRDLGLNSYSVVHPIAGIGSPLISGASDVISVVNGEGVSVC